MTNKGIRYDVQAILSLKRKLSEDIFSIYCGCSFNGKELDQLVHLIVKEMPKGVSHSAVFHSVSYLMNQELTAEEIEKISWRLAGNVPRLKKGIAVEPWYKQKEEEWVLVSITSVTPKKINVRYKQSLDVASCRVPGADFKFLVLSGTPAGILFVKPLTHKFIMFYRKKLGFSSKTKITYYDPQAKNKLLIFRNLKELTRFRCLLKLGPSEHKTGQFNIKDIKCTQSLLNWNRGLIKKRRRIGFQCPYKFNWDCQDCPVGWLRCQASYHKEDILISNCQVCEKKNNLSAPGFNSSICLNCFYTQKK